MSLVRLKVSPLGNVGHNQVILAGFFELARAGYFTATFTTDGQAQYAPDSRSDWDAIRHCVVAEIDDVGAVVFDTHDSAEVQQTLLDRCVAYFKRSYDPAAHGADARLRPLGLNYFCQSEHFSLDAAKRALAIGASLRFRFGNLARELRLPGAYRITAEELRRVPLQRRAPRLLFVARLWEPQGFANIPPEEIAHREHINALRSSVIRALKNRFGAAFTGGLISSPLAERTCPDLVVTQPFDTSKDGFLKLIDDHDICIATRGLLDSNGWSFAEYVAKGRAIVCETPRFMVTPDFVEETNYLSFADADSCCAQASRLMEDAGFRARMMAANRNYFVARGAPQALVLNALSDVFARAG
jgi:hypothetical protein